MQVQAVPTLIDQFRETFEGKISEWTWIVDAAPDSGVFGVVDALSHEQAFARPLDRVKPVAAHVAHLTFTLQLTVRRWRGENPPADWASSFDVQAPSPEAWDRLRRELHEAYEAALELLQEARGKAIEALPPIHVVGLAAMIGHNAYHLGAIRQLAALSR